MSVMRVLEVTHTESTALGGLEKEAGNQPIQRLNSGEELSAFKIDENNCLVPNRDAALFKSGWPGQGVLILERCPCDTTLCCHLS